MSTLICSFDGLHDNRVLRCCADFEAHTLHMDNGISMKQIQLWLGHSTFSTTADIYAHLDFSAQEQSASAMSGMFIRNGESA